MLACSSTDGRLDCAHLVALENCAALNICERYLFGSLLPSLLGRAVTDTGDPEWQWTWPAVKSPPPSPTWLPGQGRELGGSQAPAFSGAPSVETVQLRRREPWLIIRVPAEHGRAQPHCLPAVAAPSSSETVNARKRMFIVLECAGKVHPHAHPWLEEGGLWSPGAQSGQPPSAPAGGVTSLRFSVVSHQGRTPAQDSAVLRVSLPCVRDPHGA